jgi:hypothetical protein
MFGRKIGVLESFRGDIGCNLHFRSDEDWELAHRLLNVKDERVIGMKPESKTFFNTAEAKVHKVRVTLYSPSYPNPNFDRQLQTQMFEQREKEQENLFNALAPWHYSTEFLRKIHQIVEDELRRRSEEHSEPI